MLHVWYVGGVRMVGRFGFFPSKLVRRLGKLGEFNISTGCTWSLSHRMSCSYLSSYIYTYATYNSVTGFIIAILLVFMLLIYVSNNCECVGVLVPHLRLPHVFSRCVESTVREGAIYFWGTLKQCRPDNSSWTPCLF